MQEWVFDMAAVPAEARGPILERAASPGGDAPMDDLLAILDRVPEAVSKLRTNGIDEKIIRDTMADIGLWVTKCREKYGRWGISGDAVNWLKNHVGCSIFRIGRIQCCPKYLEKGWNLRIFQHKSSGRKLMLTAGHCDFRGDGQVSGTNGLYAEDDGFMGYYKTERVNGAAYAEGIMVAPRGHAVNTAVKLDLTQWAMVLGEGSPVFRLHIPSDGSFEPDTCLRSFKDMAAFAALHENAIEHLTGVRGPIVALTLSSWLINAQLEQMLPPEANLVKFMREFYLLPVLSNESATLHWVFNSETLDLDNLKPEHRRTSLQRAMIDFMQKGGKLRYNNGVIMFDDLGEYGCEAYRRAFEQMQREVSKTGDGHGPVNLQALS